MTEHSTTWAGDFLLLFNPPETLPQARAGASWISVHQLPGCCLYISPPVQDWRGSPISQWQEGGRTYWRIGEAWGNTDGGHFALLALDTETHQWHLRTDRCGTFHVYYGQGTEGFALGTFSPAVAAITAKTLDVEALAGFISFGFFPGVHTYHKEVSIVRPATHLVLDSAGHILKQERTWQWHHEPAPELTFGQAVDSFAGIFHQVIREQVQGRRFAFPISGGLDSRSTIAALPGDGSNAPWCYSYGYTENSPENRIAANIARARGLPYQAYVIQPYLFDKLPVVMDSVEGFQDITQCRQAYIRRELAEHADFVMAAHWGDVWLDDMGVDSAVGKDLASTAMKKFQKNGGWLLEHVIKPLAPQLDVSAWLREMLETELEPFTSIQDADFRLKALKTELWSFRWTTASIRMYQPGAFPLLPFYEPRLVDFFCTVPTDFVRGRRLQIEYLKRYATDLARIPWQVYDANLYWYRYFNSLLVPKRAVKKLVRKVNGEPILQRNWEVQFLSPGGRENLEAHLLEDGLKVHQIVNREAVRTLIEDFYRTPSAENGYTVSMLLTFAAWLERYG